MKKLVKHLLFVVFLLILCLIFSRSEVLFSESVDGEVEAGNYTFYSYSGDYKIKLVLTTHYGDADLYVSQPDATHRSVKPTYDLAEHDLQSVTCGVDVIHIPEDFRRPIGIAVYGHPNYEKSVFTLDVIGVDYFDNNDKCDDNIYITEEELQFYEDFFGEPYNGLNKVPNNKKFKKETEDHNKSEESSGWLEILFGILELLAEVFLSA